MKIGSITAFGSSAAAAVGGAPAYVLVILLMVGAVTALLQQVFPQESADRLQVWKLLIEKHWSVPSRRPVRSRRSQGRRRKHRDQGGGDQQ
ncbi:hypothetical protein GCM10027456_13670 [Kineosporia babensis]